MASDASEPKPIPVWDGLVRALHWLLTVAFVGAFATGELLAGNSAAHVWTGYAVAAIVALRIIWGFVGPKHARFGDFLFSPRAVFVYLAKLVRFRAPRYLGHSPAGGAMVVALLLGLAGSTLTGLAVYAELDGKGPLAPFVPKGGKGIIIGVPPSFAADGEAGGESFETEVRGKAPESDMAKLHAVITHVTLLLVYLHIAGVTLASFAHRENLVGAMITGKKRAE